MAGEENLVQLIKRLERNIVSLPAARRLNMFKKEERETLQILLQYVSLARAQVSFSVADEDSEAQLKGLALAAEQLETAREAIMRASMYDIVDTVDVSQLTGLIDMITARLGRLIQ